MLFLKVEQKNVVALALLPTLNNFLLVVKDQGSRQGPVWACVAPRLFARTLSLARELGVPVLPVPGTSTCMMYM